MRSNLLALQDTTANQATTQQRLATGKKVNSALDNPTNYFTAASLSARAGQLTNLLDSMTNGINTIKAASNGLDSITTTLQSMQATVTQARQDASWQSASYTVDATAIGTATAKNITFSGGAIASGGVPIALNTLTTAASFTGAGGSDMTAADLSAHSGKTITLTAGSSTTSYTFTGATTGQSSAMTTALGANGFTVTATNAGLTVSRTDGTNFTITATDATLGAAIGLGTGNATATTANGVVAAVKTVDEIVTAINGSASLTGKVKASNNAGSLQITNLSTSALTVAGVTATSVTGAVASTQSIAGNSTRSNLVTQFNQLKDQLDKTAQDASFNGINLLNGDALKLYFNENSTSSITIQSTNAAGVSASTLGVTAGTNAEFQSNTTLDSRLSTLQTAVTTVASQASAFGNNLSIVQNRQTFTNNMINTLQTGADGLTLADGNLEGANMLALQTRQQLSVQALSLASQANQAVLRLFG